MQCWICAPLLLEKFLRAMSVNVRDAAEFPLYKWRFVVLAAFSSFNFIASWTWLGFAAFSRQTVAYFGWADDSWINWYLFVGPVVFLLSTPLYSFVLNKKGLRVTCVSGSALVLGGTVLRALCLWVPLNIGWPLALAGQVLDNVAAVASMSVPAKLSSVWFGPNERSLSTSVAVVSNSLGTAAGFLFGLAYQSPAAPFDCLQFQLLLQLSFAAVSFAAVALTVRDGPATASSQATDGDVTTLRMLPELARLCCNGPFVFLVIVAGVSQGIFTAWSAMLGVILDSGAANSTAIFANQTAVGVSTTTAFLGFGSNVAGVVGGLLLGAVAIYFRRRYRLLIVICFLIGGISFSLFTLSVQNVVPFNAYSVSVLCLMGSFFVAAANPLFYELGVELAYPAPEGLVGIVIALAVNVMGSPVYPLQAYIPVPAINWLNAGNALVFCVAVLFLRESYKRNQIEVLPSEKLLDSIEPREHHKLLTNLTA